MTELEIRRLEARILEARLKAEKNEALTAYIAMMADVEMPEEGVSNERQD